MFRNCLLTFTGAETLLLHWQVSTQLIRCATSLARVIPTIDVEPPGGYPSSTIPRNMSKAQIHLFTALKSPKRLEITAILAAIPKALMVVP